MDDEFAARLLLLGLIGPKALGPAHVRQVNAAQLAVRALAVVDDATFLPQGKSAETRCRYHRRRYDQYSLRFRSRSHRRVSLLIAGVVNSRVILKQSSGSQNGLLASGSFGNHLSARSDNAATTLAPCDAFGTRRFELPMAA
ncbi:MAG: hypothetical protein ACC628_08900 [Pirellulaceae bacterium]